MKRKGEEDTPKETKKPDPVVPLGERLAKSEDEHSYWRYLSIISRDK
jgi:hypothetical protein